TGRCAPFEEVESCFLQPEAANTIKHASEAKKNRRQKRRRHCDRTYPEKIAYGKVILLPFQWSALSISLYYIFFSPGAEQGDYLQRRDHSCRRTLNIEDSPDCSGGHDEAFGYASR